jgi:hypothetical protein
MDCHIRGKLGVQCLQAFTSLAGVYEGEKPHLVVNTGGVDYDTSKKVELIYDLSIPIEERVGTNKSPYWNMGVASRIFRHRENILDKYMKPRKELLTSDNPIGVAVHARGSDKNVASEDSYVRLINEAKDIGDPLLFSDDIKLARRLAKKTKISIASSEDVVKDYAALLNARIVFSAPNAFILSMLLLRPNKDIRIAGRSYCDGDYVAYQNDLDFAEEAQDYCKNVSII